MSALPSKADMRGATRDVRYGPIADILIGRLSPKRRTPGRGALIVKRLRGHSRSLPLPALAEQAGCGETANQPQKMYPYVMRLTLNHDGCD